MEFAPVGQVRHGVYGVVLAVAIDPVRRGDDLIGGVFGFLVTVAVARPRDAIGRHFVRFIRRAGPPSDVKEDGGGEAVVEHGVRDEAAGVVRLAVLVCDQRGACVGGVELRLGAVAARELALVKRFDVATVVLVEVCETVIEQDWRVQLRRKRELECADRGGHVLAHKVRGGGVDIGPFRGVSVAERGFEGG